jgi:Ala-tRNA(Pro) deacylase
MAKIGDMVDYLKRNGVSYEIIEHVAAFSAHEVAVASHVQDKDLAKTLVVLADDKYCMVVMPADHRLDMHKLGEIIKAKHVHLAQEENLKSLFPDCELGAMPPFGNLYALEVYMDKVLVTDDKIVFNACSHTKSIRLKMQDYIRLVEPVIAEFSRSRFEIDERELS